LRYRSAFLIAPFVSFACTAGQGSAYQQSGGTGGPVHATGGVGSPATGGSAGSTVAGSGGVLVGGTSGGRGGAGGGAGMSLPGRGGGTTEGSGGSGAAGTTSGGGGTGGSLDAAMGGTSTGGIASGGAPGGSGGAPGTDAGTSSPERADARPVIDVAEEAPAADAQSLPGTNNPVLSGLYADPNIVVFDGTFYLYPTTDGVDGWGATSFTVFSSTNMVKWTRGGVILDVPTALTWATGHAWAPSIVRVASTYYFYFSADSQLGVATGSSPTGPFKDALGKPLATTGQYGPQSIDPYAFIDEDGTPYLYFGSASGGLRMAKLNANMTSFSETPTNISPSGAGGTLEGSAVFKRKGTYYLVWSEGDTRTATYQMAYARASSPKGPFTRLATILQQDTAGGILGPGGGTVLGIPARDEYYLAYHRFKIPGGDGTHRETCIDRMTFNTDGTVVPVKPTLAGLQATVAP